MSGKLEDIREGRLAHHPKERCADHLQFVSLSRTNLNRLQHTDETLFRFSGRYPETLGRWEEANKYQGVEAVVQMVSGAEVNGLKDFQEEKRAR